MVSNGCSVSGSSFSWAPRPFGPSNQTPTLGMFEHESASEFSANTASVSDRPRFPHGRRPCSHALLSRSLYLTPVSLAISALFWLDTCVSNWSSVDLRSQLICSTVGLGVLKIFVPPEKVLRWIEGKLNLLGRLPHYVSVDQKTYGRYGVLPTTTTGGERGTPMSFLGSSQRLGP